MLCSTATTRVLVERQPSRGNCLVGGANEEAERMPKYLIEVPHPPDTLSCARVIKTFLEIGSHYLTQAEWGCADGDHRAWLIVETADREEARQIVPPIFRSEARVVRLTRFSMDEIDRIIERHS